MNVTRLATPRRFALLAGLLTGCYAELTAGYYPKLAVEPSATVVAAPPRSEASAVMVGLNLGAYLDLFGVGAYYGFVGEDTVRETTTLPNHFGAKGRWLRLDVDLPVRFAKDWLGLRATYVLDQVSTAKLGPSVDEQNQSVPASGNGHFAGLTLAVPGNDISLALGARTFTWNTEGQALWPAFRVGGTGAVARLMVRWVPTGAAWAYYKPPGAAGARISEGNSCPAPRTTRTCTYHQSGYRCYETTSCH